MNDILLKIHSFETKINLLNFFRNVLIEKFNLKKFTLVVFNDSEFLYNVILSTEFKEEDYFFDTELNKSCPFLIEQENKSVNVLNIFSYNYPDNVNFKLLIHSESNKLDEIELLFKHFVISYQKLTLLKYYQNSVISSKIQLDFLNEIGDILGNFDLQIVLTKVLENAVNLVDGDVGVIFLKENDELTEKISWGVPKDTLKYLVNKITGKSVIEEIFENQTTVLIENLNENSEYYFSLNDRYSIKSFIGLPIFTKNRNLGIIALLNFEIDLDFTETKLATLETLTRISSIGIENAIFFRDLIEKEKLNTLLKIAADVQKSLLPEHDIITDQYYIGGFSYPAYNVGGDFYFYTVSEDKKKIIGFVGDVAGKGIPAALLTSMAMILIKTMVRFDSNLSEDIYKINNIITKENIGEKYFTLGIFKLDVENRTGEIVNAGHTEILHFCYKEKKVKKYYSNNVPIGMFEDMEFETTYFTFDKGDLIFNVSDGIPDAINEAGERYELDRLIKLIQNNYDLSPELLKKRVLMDIYDFCGNAEQFDDLTLLLFKIFN